LIKKRTPEYKDHELPPREVRIRFEENKWKRVVGFHTRNVIHRGHEYIQLQALEKSNCDGLFIHPVIGKKNLVILKRNAS
jgi:ATP sulfurylase